MQSSGSVAATGSVSLGSSQVTASPPLLAPRPRPLSMRRDPSPHFPRGAPGLPPHTAHCALEWVRRNHPVAPHHAPAAQSPPSPLRAPCPPNSRRSGLISSCLATEGAVSKGQCPATAAGAGAGPQCAPKGVGTTLPSSWL